MNLGLRIRLSTMMFFEFFIWAAWVTVLGVHIEKLGFSQHLGTIFGLMGLASIFMPTIAGQITDRMIPTQVFLGVAHLVGAVGLVLASQADSESYGLLYWGMFIWALAYAPTISLTNSLSFSHLKDPEKDFGPIRVFGTFGWIAAGVILTLWRKTEGLHIEGVEGNDCLYLAAGASAVMGLFCFTLPHTPPVKSGVSAFAFAKAFSMLRTPRVAVFLAVSFVVGMSLQFYFTLSGPFLKVVGVTDENMPAIQVIGQASEIVAMLALPWFLKKYGPRLVLFYGVIAGAIRFIIFSVGGPYELVVGSLATHGFFFVFFFVVGFIYIDMAAPKDIKASAQGLLTLVVFGLGFWVGNICIDEVKMLFTVDDVINWRNVFLVPTGMTVVCAVIFLLTFPKGSMKDATASEGNDDEASAMPDMPDVPDSDD